MAERLGDLCFDTIKSEIQIKIENFLQTQNLNLPHGLNMSQLSTHIHHDSEDLQQFILTILKNLTEFGANSAEFLQVVQFISNF